MSYIQHEWKEHEPITPAKMNNIEEGVANLSLDAASGLEYENKENITGTINSSSNNINYPNTKAVYDYMQDKTRSIYHNDIRIDNPPNKIKYINGENFDLTGLIISCLEKTTCKQKVNNAVSDKVISNSRITTAFPNSKITYSPSQAYIPDMPKNQEQTLDYKITWTNHTSETHEVLTTNGQVTVTTYVADSIRLYNDSGLKKEYIQGENIDLTGLQLRSYDVNDNYISDISVSSLTFSPTTAYVEDLDEDEKELTITVSYEEPLYHEVLTYLFKVVIYNNKWVICSVENLDSNNILNYISSSGANGDTWLRGKEIRKVLANAAYSISSEKRNRIGKVSFENCWKIESSGFYSCQYLSFVKFNACSLAEYAFYNCEQLTSVEGLVTDISLHTFDLCKKLESLSLYIIGSIPDYAFNSCYNLQSIEENIGTGGSQHKIGECAFRHCNKLSYLELATDFIEIGSKAFEGCSSLSSISFSYCKKINERAFYSCHQLKTVSLPKCEYIGSSAFRNCHSLENLSFPQCSIIYEDTFLFCDNLSTINLPECLSIGYRCFGDCSNLKYIYLSKCQHISGYAFNNCSIESLYLFTSTICSTSGVIHGEVKSVYVPASLVSDYKTAQYWSYYSSKITAIPT